MDTEKNSFGLAFGAWLKTEREARQISSKLLKARAKIGQSSLSQLQSGVRKPSRKMVLRIAQALFAESADTAEINRTIAAGLKVAGYSAEEYEGDHPVVDLLRQLPPTEQDKLYNVINTFYPQNENEVDHAA